MIDYKINTVIDNGATKRTVYTLYEGEVTTEDELSGLTNEFVPVTRYRRTKKLESGETTTDITTKSKDTLDQILKDKATALSLEKGELVKVIDEQKSNLEKP